MMTVGEMLGYTNRFKQITESRASRGIKNHRLANLMTDLETVYWIPLFKGERLEAFEKEQPFVMQLYKTVSAERSV